MGEERMLDALLSKQAIQAANGPRVVEIDWQACTDEAGRESLEVRILVDAGRGARGGPPGRAALSGARSIWEAVLERMHDSGDPRFPYVSIRFLATRSEDGDGAQGKSSGGPPA